MSKRDTSTQKTGNTTKNQASVFKPLIASSLALALGVSVGMAQSVGTNNGSDPYLEVTYSGSVHTSSLKASSLSSGDGSASNPWVWTYSGWLANNGETFNLTLKNGVLKLGDSGTNTVGGNGNSAKVFFSVTDATLIGNITTKQNSSNGSYTFSGNGQYIVSGSSEKYALIGNFTSVGQGANAVVNFNNGANLKGDIIATTPQTVPTYVTANFTSTSGQTQRIDGNVQGYGSGGKATVTFKGAGNAVLNGDIVIQDANADVVFNNSGTATFSGNIDATKNSQGGSGGTIKITFSKNGVIQSTSFQQTSPGNATQVYIRSGSSNGNTLSVNDGIDGVSITLSASGGGKERKLYITDYDATSLGNNLFGSNLSSILGSLTLNIKSLTLLNSEKTTEDDVSFSKGQQFVVDYNHGDITINSGTSTGSISNDTGSTIAIRLRDNTSNLTIGQDGLNNGSISSSGLKSQAFLQVNTIKAYGSIGASSNAITTLQSSSVLANSLNASSSGSIVFSGTNISAASTIKADSYNAEKGGKIYFLLNDTNTNSLSITNKDDEAATFNLSGPGGVGGSAIYITDYDSRTSGFSEIVASPTKASASFNLNAKQITMSNYGGSTGQSFVLDYDQGTAIVDNKTANTKSIDLVHNHQKVLMRYRSTTADTAITIGGKNSSDQTSLNNGSVSFNGSGSQGLFQAKTIAIYGSVTSGNKLDFASVTTAGGSSLNIAGDLSVNGTTTFAYNSNTSGANTLTIGGNFTINGGTTTLAYNNNSNTQATNTLSIGGDFTVNGGTTSIDLNNTNASTDTLSIGGYLRTNFGKLTITDAATPDNEITAQAIYSLGDYRISGVTNITAKQVKIGFVGNIKSDGSGGSASPSNTITAQTVLINSDLNSGANIKGATLEQQDGKIVLGALPSVARVGETSGNVAIFNNITKGSNTIISVNTAGANASKIYGDVYTFGGSNNIKLSGSADIASADQANFVGNIYTNNGSNNFVFDKTYWIPNQIFDTKTAPLAKINSGAVVTNGGTSNIVFRQGDTDLLKGKIPTFSVTTNAGSTNIVMQANLAVAQSLSARAIINYTGGTTSLIFAKENNIDAGGGAGKVTDDSFDSQIDDPNGGGKISATSASENRILGVTYSNGVKLTLKNDSVKIGNETVNLVDKYGNNFRDENGNLFVLTSERGVDADTITFDGLAIGEITSLKNSATKTYNNTLTTGSAFVGAVNLDNTTATATLEMQANSKLILTGDKSTMAALALSGNQTTINTNQLVLETLAQTENRVVNLATNGGSVTNISKRSNFRLLEIGSNGGGINTGLLGNANETIVFTTYVNTNANQVTQVTDSSGSVDSVVSQGASLGGVDTFVQKVDAPASRAAVGDSYTEGLGIYGYSYADRIIIHNVGNGSGVVAKDAGSVYLQFAVDADTNLGAVKYNDATNASGKGGTAIEGNVAVLTVKNSANGGADKALIKLETKDTLQGFDVLSGTVEGVASDEFGITNGDATSATGDYTTYFITSLSTTGADSAIQDTVSSAFATSLDIFAANFNSLNKRMGELRDNANSQGAWGRVFGGQQTSDFGLGSETTYVTVQAGYDYAFGFEGANNYLGFALAYSNSSSKTSNATNTLNGVSEGLEGDMKSNMVEVGIYNAYVQDEGWYNDSIFKFSYIMNDFSTTGTASGNSVSTTNYGIVLSDEFGYRFKLGDAKEWYIDPQLEVAFGYVNGTEYTLTSGRSELQAKSDSLMQLRARFGSSFGYDFKQFTQGKGVDAKLYVGAFYEYDYFNGGDVTLSTNLGGVNSIQSSLASDGRVVVNVGTNMTVKENTRIYFDFETSFAGKIRTDYQANVGVRYSFGENAGYTPLDPNKKSITPLKVSDENAEESEESQESTQTTTSEQTSEANKESANSKDNKTEESTEAKSEEKAQ